MLGLLEDVTWHGTSVRGERPRALLARLVLARGRVVADEALVEELWSGGGLPAHPGKALQVVVSRVRAQTAADVVLRGDGGYRLGLDPAAVDVLAVEALVAEAVAAETADPRRARDLAARALTTPPATAGGAGRALAETRAAVAAALVRARLVLGRTSSALGQPAAALAALETVPDPDEATLAALLRSEAAVRGSGPALERYEAHRRALSESTGSDPGPLLRAVQAELLARDRPVRAGLRHEASSMIGRTDDVASVTALVRASRVVSIVGPGGLGKTRLAHVVSSGIDLPVVRFVELVGVTSADDLVAEVGSALGVRDSVGERRVLGVEQRRDVRSRIAQQLDRAPTLLVLDNCEHLVEAVADLVAHVVAASSVVRVLTTSRAPLAIAAERVVALAPLDEDASARLFVERARAARPGATLDDDAVRRVVARLDGLPLAVELAAARVRAMSVDQVAERLEDRFALLRGGDRSAPDRHRTLLAVIDWSWQLLTAGQQRALAALSVFADGFGLGAVEAVLGADALDLVTSLAEQSLVSVVDAAGGVRYRMLETVREFATLRLAESGATGDAREALSRWARQTSGSAAARLYSPDQVAALDTLAAEEGNLTDVLGRALADDDVEAVVVLLAGLGGLWTLRGDHARVMVLVDAAERLLDGYDPPADLVDHTVMAATVLVLNAAIGFRSDDGAASALVARHVDRVSWPSVRATARVIAAADVPARDSFASAMRPLWDDPDRLVAANALQWSSHGLENDGDPLGAVEVAERALALWRPEDGPWTRCLLHTQLAGVHTQLGHETEATRNAAQALPFLDRIGAVDDAVQLRAIIAVAAISAGRLEEAEALVDRIGRDEPRAGLGGAIAGRPVRAELELARGRTEEGLRQYVRAVEALRELRLPGPEHGVTAPWVVYGLAAATTAFARALPGTGDADLRAAGAALRDDLRSRATELLDPDARHHDYPIAGLLAVGLGRWELAAAGEEHLDAAVRLLALAERCGYHRLTPSLSWARVSEPADRRRPGRLEADRAELATLSGPVLLREVRELVAGLPARTSQVP